MKAFYRRNLPHIQPQGATLFITFRLYGSLPRSVLDQLHQEYKQFGERHRGKSQDEMRSKFYEFQKRLIVRYDRILDQNLSGPHYLKDPRIAELVCNAMKYWDQKRYDLLCYCVMSNHVHMVLSPLCKQDGTYYSLASIMHSIKSFTANKANELLQRRGNPFWEHESFDHYCRDEREVERAVAYVLYNPVKAGLVEQPSAWPWNYCKYGIETL